MKGITHFSMGVAAASCFPAAVEAGAEGSPLYFLLGGAMGLLPDTLDFKFWKFCSRHDMQIVPDPAAPDPALIADGIAEAMNRAYVEGKPVSLKLSTIPVEQGCWLRYTLHFDVRGRGVEVEMGPVVDMSGNEVRDPVVTGRRARAELLSNIQLDYLADINVDILDGPSFRMEYDSSLESVRPLFIPWHRSWSHSYVVAAILAMAVAALFGVYPAAAAFTAYALHITSDQLGYMGSNLFFPFTRKRFNGLKIAHSGWAGWNFGAAWVSCLVIFWNLYAGLTWRVESLTVIRVAFYLFLLPLMAVVWMPKLPGLLRFKRSRFF